MKLPFRENPNRITCHSALLHLLMLVSSFFAQPSKINVVYMCFVINFIVKCRLATGWCPFTRCQSGIQRHAVCFCSSFSLWKYKQQRKNLTSEQAGLHTRHCSMMFTAHWMSTLMFPFDLSVQAMFELVTSEASYYKSLEVLENHFLRKPALINTLSQSDMHFLFSNIEEVMKASER